MRLRDIRKAKVRGRRVLVRVDFNSAITRRRRGGGNVKIAAAGPMLKWLLNRGASVVVVSHRGRPQGRQLKFSLRPCVAPLSRLLQQPVRFIATPIFKAATAAAVDSLRPGQLALLENIRFAPGEASNSPRLARRLASFADLAVNDAFADSHRRHASVSGLSRFIPTYAGFLLQREFRFLSLLTGRPDRPYIAVLGGAKISTKLGLVRSLLKKTDAVLLGGGLANTVLQAEGLAIGRSVSEPRMLRAARGLTVSDARLKIPVDVVVARRTTRRAKRHVRAVGKIGRTEKILDIGPATVELYSQVIRQARTVVWNGPMGLYEVPPFDRGTNGIARAIASGRRRAIAGGGETIEAIRAVGVAKKFTFLSTGGGAMLEFLEGKTLPGLKAVAS